MKIIITEQQQFTILEVNRKEGFDEKNPIYTYKNAVVLPSKHNPNKKVIFFNGTNFGKSDYVYVENDIPNVIFDGDKGKFTINKKDIKINNGSPFINYDVLSNEEQNRLNPIKTHLTIKKIISVKPEFTPEMIRLSLEKAYPENWKKSDENYTEGLRGVYRLEGLMSGLGDWSIMNYFDTRTIPKLINKKWDEEGSGDQIVWLSNIFKDKDSEFLKELIREQVKSLKSGFITEKKSLENLLKKLEDNGEVVEEVITYPPGHIKDRIEGIDFSVKLKGHKLFNVQVKPLTGYGETKDGKYDVHTHNMLDYKSKSNLDFILYNKDDYFYLFRNKNYVVNSEKNVVTHNDKPILEN